MSEAEKEREGALERIVAQRDLLMREVRALENKVAGIDLALETLGGDHLQETSRG